MYQDTTHLNCYSAMFFTSLIFIFILLKKKEIFKVRGPKYKKKTWKMDDNLKNEMKSSL